MMPPAPPGMAVDPDALRRIQLEALIAELMRPKSQGIVEQPTAPEIGGELGGY